MKRFYFQIGWQWRGECFQGWVSTRDLSNQTWSKQFRRHTRMQCHEHFTNSNILLSWFTLRIFAKLARASRQPAYYYTFTYLSRSRIHYLPPPPPHVIISIPVLFSQECLDNIRTFKHLYLTCIRENFRYFCFICERETRVSYIITARKRYLLSSISKDTM